MARKYFFLSLYLSIAILGAGIAGCSGSDPGSSLFGGIKSSGEGNTGSGCDEYLVGVGIYDITGPAAEVVMGGFAVDDQKTAGISMRLWSRAFIVADPDDNDKRVVFVSADTWAMCQSVKQEVARRLAGDPELGKYYGNDNVCLSATHSHSSVAGFSHYFLYNVPNKGFIEDSFEALAGGIFESIKLAHKNLRPGRIYVAEGKLENAGWNRSASMYENNPADERAGYEANTDTTMTLLKFTGFDDDGKETAIGMICWFAVHPDCVGPSNRLISGDSKGLASYLFEKYMGADYSDDSTFVAAFAQSNAGDVTPNVPFTKQFYSKSLAAKALADYGITNTDAEIASSGFPWAEAKGEADPEKNIVLKLEATRQYRKALELFEGTMQPVHGSVDFRHEFVDMRNLYVESAGCLTCASGMGASYSYGSPADNPTPYPIFGEGVARDDVNVIDWNSGDDVQETIIASLLPGVISLIWPKVLTKEYIECHGVKPVILPSGLMSFSIFKFIPLMPQVLPVQVLKIGNLVIAGQPTEITTMAGRRVKKTLLSSFPHGEVDHAVVAGLSNTYASYLATYEEYLKQGYEGGGTMFGPYELEAFQQEYVKLCSAIVTGDDVESGPEPPDLRGCQVNFTTGVVLDDVPPGKKFGSVDENAAAEYSIGSTVSVTFWGAHPRNNLHTMGTFLTVEMITSNGNVIVRRDYDPDTKFSWKRSGIAYSKVIISWNTTGAEPGKYVIRYYGDYKTLTGNICSFSGVSRKFIVR